MLAIFPDWHRQKHGEKLAKTSDYPSRLVIGNISRMCGSGNNFILPVIPVQGSQESFWGHMLIYDPDIAAKTIVIIKNLLIEGKLTPACIDESYARIVQCKERLGKFQ